MGLHLHTADRRKIVNGECPRKRGAIGIPTENRPYRAVVESLESRLLLSVTRTINGRVFFDLRDKGTFLPKDHWLAGVEVFLDLNGNGVLDPGEPSTVTNKAGTFTFRKLRRGTYDVVVIPPAGDGSTNPADGIIVAAVEKHSLLSLRFGLHTAPDTTPPAASLSASALTTAGMSPYQFAVAWTDPAGLELSSFGDGNIVVTGIDGFNQPADLVSVNSTANGTPRTTTYQIPAPASSWNSNDDGTYTVTLEGGQVRDTLGNADPTMVLGTFAVSIPSINPDAPALIGGLDDATANNNSSGSTISFDVSNTTPDSTLTLLADGTAIGSAAVTATETEITSSGMVALSDGPHQFVVDETLADGTQEDSATSTVTVDTAPPAGELTAPTLIEVGSSTYDFTITWTDATAVSVASLGGQDLIVTGAGGFSQVPALLSLDADVNGPMRVATYQLTAPGGTWTAANDGTYTVTLLPGLAMDEVGNTAPGGPLGTFSVAVGQQVSATPAAPSLMAASETGAFDDDNITDLNNSSSARALQVEVSGTDSGAVVSLYSDGTLIASGTATGSSIVLTTNGSTKLADGTHLLTARQTNPGMAQSAASTATGIFVDTQPPTATCAPASIDAIGATSYSFSVVYQDNLSLNVLDFATGNVIVTGPSGFSSPATFDSVNAQGDGSPRTVTYSITPPGGSWQPADNGTYAIKLQAKQVFDIAGNAAAAATLATFTVSANLPPSPSPLAPALLPVSDIGGGGLTNLNNGSAPDELQFSIDGTIAGAAVMLYADGTLIGSATASGTTTTVTTNGTTPLANGPHTITARQTVAGNGQSPDSAGTTVTIDTSPPAVSSLSAPAVGSSDAGATSYTFTVTFTDSQGVDALTLNSSDLTVTSPAGGTIGAAFVSANPDANVTPIVATYVITPPGGSWTSADDGTYTINLQGDEVGDTLGNFAAASTVGQFTVNVPAPVSPTPGAPVLQPASDTGGGGLTNLNNSSTASELQFSVGGTVAGATVFIIHGGGGVLGSAVATGSTTIVTTSGTLKLANGTHNILAYQTVPGDSPSADSSNTQINVNAAPPTASLSAPDVGSSGFGAASYTFTVAYSDNVAVDVTSLGSANVTVTPPGGGTIAADFVSANPNADGTPVVATYAITPPGGSWTIGDNGTYTVNLLAGQVRDTAGNTAPAATLGQFTVGLASPTPDVPVLLSANDNGLTNLNNSSTSTELQFSVGGTVAGATVSIQDSGGVIGSAVATGSTTTVTTDGSTALADGTYSIVASQTVPGDAESAESGGATVIIDTARPTAMSLSAPAVGASDSGATSYTFTVTYADSQAVDVTSLGNGDVTVTPPGGGTINAAFVSASPNADGTPIVATYSITPPGGSWTSADNGNYSVNLHAGQVRDTAGNTAAAATLGHFDVNVPVPVTATPAAPVLAAASTTGITPDLTNLNNTSSGSALQFTVPNTIAGATVTIYSDETAIGTAVASGSTTTVTTNGITLLTDGSHNITARQQLSGQTQSPDSSALAITVDTAAPTASADASDVTASGGTSYTFTVAYTDEVAINTATVQGGAVLVTGPNGFSVLATFVSVNNPSNGTPCTATYTITPPNGSWDMSANGTYTLTLQPNQVFDTAGNTAVSANIGTFNVNIPMGG